MGFEVEVPGEQVKGLEPVSGRHLARRVEVKDAGEGRHDGQGHVLALEGVAAWRVVPGEGAGDGMSQDACVVAAPPDVDLPWPRWPPHRRAEQDQIPEALLKARTDMFI